MSHQHQKEKIVLDDEHSVESSNYILPESLDINEIQFSQEDPFKIGIKSSRSFVNKVEARAANNLEAGSSMIPQNEVCLKLHNFSQYYPVDNKSNHETSTSRCDEVDDVELSQGDHALITLDKQGELNDVIGSESILTQELASGFQFSQNLSQSTSRCHSPNEEFELLNKKDCDKAAIDDAVSSFSTLSNRNFICQSPGAHQRIRNKIDNNLDSLLTAVHIVGSPDAMRMARKHSMRLRLGISESDDYHRAPPRTRSKSSGKAKSPNRAKSKKDTDANSNQVDTKLNELNKKVKKRQRNENAEFGVALVCSSASSQSKKVTPSTDSSTVMPSFQRSSYNLKSDDDRKLNNNNGDESMVNQTDHEDDDQIAHEAASLAARALKDHNLASRLLLSLILTREKPGKNEAVVANVEALNATVDNPYSMPVGFQWCDYPPLEEVLKKYRRQYYELSMDPTLRQTVEQLSFNNRLVALIRQTGVQNHWIFHQKDVKDNDTKKGGNQSNSKTCPIRDRDNEISTNNNNNFNWTEKALRDRIRFYYKTNLQNARGRLQTMLKNPSKRSNARNLKELYQLLQNNYAPVKNEQSP